MSAVKFEYPTYKLFEPQYHPQRPIIVDADAIESPDTVTLRYEEAAARANGGDLRGDSPPGLLSMSAYSKPEPGQMHAFEPSRSYQDPQYQYPAPQFNAAQQSENEAAQLNQMAFAANNAASQYMTSVMPTLISYQPSAGVFGTKVMVKISAAYDLIAVTSHFFLGFGSHKCPAHAIRDTSDASGYGYVVSADAPQSEDTRSASANVPLSLLIETPEGQTLASIEVGTFTYHDGQAGAAESPTDSVTRKDSRSPEHKQSPPRQEPAQLADPATNSFGYPQTANQAVAPGYDPSFANNGNMIGTYHRTSYATDYHHPRPPPLKTSSWSPYGSSLAAHRSSGLGHTALSRPSLTALPPPTPSAPALVRTSTIQQAGPSVSGQYNSYHIYNQKVSLKINGDLQSMELGWTTEEWDNRRRIVMFNKKHVGTVLTTSFRPISVNERPPNSICISCIYWAEKDECYVTSVDTISLLEQLLTAPTKFSVEEKNRIRRNLEGFRPLTVSKAKPESEEFFKIIMAFGNPKPRNIEKDVKVFPWKILPQALKKIISKYSVNPTSVLPPGPSPALLTPVSNASPGLYAPPPPYTSSVHDNAYSHHDSHHSAPSPRSVPGTASTWTAYPTSRTLSPSLKHSPQPTSLRIPSLPSYATMDSRQQHNHHAYSTNGRWQDGLSSQAHSRWDTTGVTATNGYSDGTGTSPYTSHQHHSQVYGNGTYGDSGHRE